MRTKAVNLFGRRPFTFSQRSQAFLFPSPHHRPPRRTKHPDTGILHTVLWQLPPNGSPIPSKARQVVRLKCWPKFGKPAGTVGAAVEITDERSFYADGGACSVNTVVSAQGVLQIQAMRQHLILLSTLGEVRCGTESCVVQFQRECELVGVPGINTGSEEGKIAAEKQDVAASKGKTASATQDVAATEGKVAAAKQDVAVAEGKVATAKQDVATAEVKVAAAKQDVAAAEVKVAEAEVKVAAAIQDVAAAEVKVAAAKQDVAAAKKVGDDTSIAASNRLFEMAIAGQVVAMDQIKMANTVQKVAMDQITMANTVQKVATDELEMATVSQARAERALTIAQTILDQARSTIGGHPDDHSSVLPDLHPAVRKSFDKNVFKGSTHKDLLFEILHKRNSGDEIKHVVPLVQSSGWGKTRSLIQCAVDNESFVLYYHVRTAGNGWPKPKAFPELESVMKKPGEDEMYNDCCNRWRDFFQGQLELLHHNIEKDPSHTFLKMYDWRTGTFGYGDVFRTSRPSGSVGSLCDALPKLKGQTVLFVLDEAAALSRIAVYDDSSSTSEPVEKNLYFAARNAAIQVGQELSDHCTFVMVPVATASNLRDVVPPVGVDVSTRSDQHTSDPVVNLLQNMDILYSEDRSVQSVPEVWKERPDGNVLCQLGRPLWATNDKSAAFAAKKLLCQNLSDVRKCSKPEPAWVLAVVGALCGSFTSPAHLVTNLVEYNMCTAIDPFVKHIVKGMYFSEPLLAAGARYCLREFDIFGMRTVLEVIRSEFSKSPSNPGSIGEFVCCLVMLECMESIAGGHNLTFPVVPLREFAKALIPGDVLDPEDFPEEMFISFNHFVNLSNEDDSRTQIAYGRCAAIVAQPNEQTVDGEIPVICGGNKMKRWYFQVKNRKQKRNLPQFDEQFASHFPLLVLELGLSGSMKAEKSCVGNNSIYHISLWDAPFIQGAGWAKEAKALVDLSRTIRPDGNYRRLYPPSPAT